MFQCYNLTWNQIRNAITLFYPLKHFSFISDVTSERKVIAVDEIMSFHVRRGFILKLSSEILFNMEPGL